MNGFIRNMDHLGRIVVPMEFRKTLNVDTRCEIALEIRDGSIVLTPHQTLCFGCGTTIPSKTKYHLCESCIKAIQEKK